MNCCISSSFIKFHQVSSNFINSIYFRYFLKKTDPKEFIPRIDEYLVELTYIKLYFLYIIFNSSLNKIIFVYIIFKLNVYKIILSIYFI